MAGNRLGGFHQGRDMCHWDFKFYDDIVVRESDAVTAGNNETGTRYKLCITVIQPSEKS